MWALGPPNPSPQGPHHPSPSTPVMQTLRTESRVPSGRSPPPSGQARTASCTRGQPCTAPRRSDLARKGGLLLGAAGTLACVLPQAVPCTELRNWGQGGGSTPAPCVHALFSALLTALALTLQPAEPVKRQPRSQCLSTLVRPVFGEVRAGPGDPLGQRAVVLLCRRFRAVLDKAYGEGCWPPCGGVWVPGNPLWLDLDLGARLSVQRGRSG